MSPHTNELVPNCVNFSGKKKQMEILQRIQIKLKSVNHSVKMIIPNGTNFRELHLLVLAELRNAGVKHRIKKTSSKYDQGIKSMFGAPLATLPQCEIKCCGSYLNIPIVVRDMSDILTKEAHVEGLFRKAGSQSRQREIKEFIESNGYIEQEGANPVDVACVLKRLLRSLPEPLICSDVQDLLLMCRVSDVQPDMIFHVLLLLPLLHIHLLHHLMELLNRIASKHSENSMDATNLAIVMVPSVMPLTQTASPLRLQHHVQIVKYLIENARLIGHIPEGYIEKINSNQFHISPPKKKKRRSGSFSRVIQGICKMVSGSEKTQHISSSNNVTQHQTTPVILNSSTKNQQIQGGLSAKARNEIRSQLPSRELFATPIKLDKKFKKLQKIASSNFPLNVESNINAIDKYKSTPSLDSIDKKQEDDGFVHISKNEYEEIKKRVSAIEDRLSKELNDLDKPLQNVQDCYERTLNESTRLSSSDRWTRRLSRELKIKQTGERKIIRSPSARKIGTVRRRSKENVNDTRECFTKLNEAENNEFHPYVGLKRRISSAETTMKPIVSYDASDIIELKKKIRRCSYNSTSEVLNNMSPKVNNIVPYKYNANKNSSKLGYEISSPIRPKNINVTVTNRFEPSKDNFKPILKINKYYNNI